MSFAVVYDWPALATLYNRIDWRTASDIDAAVHRFAATRAATMAPAPAYRLRTAGYDVVLAIDSATRVVTVLRLYQARSPR